MRQRQQGFKQSATARTTVVQPRPPQKQQCNRAPSQHLLHNLLPCCYRDMDTCMHDEGGCRGCTLARGSSYISVVRVSVRNCMSMNSPRRPWQSSMSVPTWSLGVMISILHGGIQFASLASQRGWNRCVGGYGITGWMSTSAHHARSAVFTWTGFASAGFSMLDLDNKDCRGQGCPTTLAEAA